MVGIADKRSRTAAGAHWHINDHVYNFFLICNWGHCVVDSLNFVNKLCDVLLTIRCNLVPTCLGHHKKINAACHFASRNVT